MTMVIKAMKYGIASDWFDFIDHRCFADHQDWKRFYYTDPFTPRLRGMIARVP
jgi:hypothetical protein